MCSSLNARTVSNYVEGLKVKTKCKRAIVIIDYLQVWPTDPTVRPLSEIEADKWRIGEMKKIRDALGGDPVIVISEARKPSSKDGKWGGDLSDVMGTARFTYTPDVVMLLLHLRPGDLVALWEKYNLPSLKNACLDKGGEERGIVIENVLRDKGILLCKLIVPKVRDGMEQFTILLEFYFQRNEFRKFDSETLKEIGKNIQMLGGQSNKNSYYKKPQKMYLDDWSKS